jgi:GNAT superfamily N-acetyltransferase
VGGVAPIASTLDAREESGLEIGPVRDSDLDAISKLHAHFWGEVSDVEAMQETLSRLGDDPDHVLLSARIDGACVGTATGAICHGLYGGSDSYLVVEDVVVDPEYRRRGVATALLGELERQARAQGCKQIILLTESCRDDAVALYHAAGFAGRWTGFKKKL